MRESFFRICLYLYSCITVIVFSAVPVSAKECNDPSAVLHHMHAMIDHGLIMALQGSDLLMLGSMKPSGGVDKIAEVHGRRMISEGKALVGDILSGKEMKKLHQAGKWDDPLMAYTHDLGAAVLAVLDDIHKIPGEGEVEFIRLRQVHVLLNHVVEMAAEGADLVMLGNARVTETDADSITHGRKMIADARALLNEVSSGELLRVRETGSPIVLAVRKRVTHDEKLVTVLEKMATLRY